MATLELPVTTGVTLSERAAQEIHGLLERQDKKDAALRVFVSGGGCSGLNPKAPFIQLSYPAKI